jgi:hypothetical protein
MMKFKYIECECSSPWHTIRVSDDEDGHFLEFGVYPKTWWQRIKAAWACLRGKPTTFTDVLLWKEGHAQLASALGMLTSRDVAYMAEDALGEMVARQVGGDKVKAGAWWGGYNKHLEGKPIDLFHKGEYKKLYDYLSRFC